MKRERDEKNESEEYSLHLYSCSLIVDVFGYRILSVL